MKQRDLLSGMEAAADHAERSVDGWVEMAIDKLRGYAKRTSEPFTIEQARLALEKRIPLPPDARAWGSVARKAAARGLIRRVGFRPAESSHGSAKPAYRVGRAA